MRTTHRSGKCNSFGGIGFSAPFSNVRRLFEVLKDVQPIIYPRTIETTTTN